VERLDETGGEEVKTPDAEHVRVLWRMDRNKRVQVWRRLGRFEEVEELELGGQCRCECPLDKEELFMLLPEGGGALAGLQKLLLWWCGRQVDDDFLRFLVSLGCGKNLTSLRLGCECLFFCFFCFLLVDCFSPVLRFALSLCLASPPRCLLFLARSLSLIFFVFLSLSLSADKRIERNAGLKEGVTDASVQALAEAGCGKNLTSLTLSSEFLFLLFLCFLLVALFFSCSCLASPPRCLLFLARSLSLSLSSSCFSLFPSLLTRESNETQA